MKKIIICLLIVIISSCSDNRTKEREKVGSKTKDVSRSTVGYWIEYEKTIIDSMEFGTFQYPSTGGIFVINLTKEKLEVELLKKQLSK